MNQIAKRTLIASFALFPSLGQGMRVENVVGRIDLCQPALTQWT